MHANNDSCLLYSMELLLVQHPHNREKYAKLDYAPFVGEHSVPCRGPEGYSLLRQKSLSFQFPCLVYLYYTTALAIWQLDYQSETAPK